MAGIAGIISKNQKENSALYRAALNRMLTKLAFDSNQVSSKFECSNVWFCNAVPMAQKKNINFIQDQESDTFCVIDGFVFVSEEEEKSLSKELSLSNDLSSHKTLPYLYKRYGHNIVNHLTGNYNIFIYDKPQGIAYLFNDRLGYLPLYLYEDDKVLLFASKIESILASGLMGSIEFDPATIAEHLFLNYPISDHTYIKRITTLPDASILSIQGQTITNNHYWDVSELFSLGSLNKKQSIEAIDSGLKVAIDKLFSITSKPINFSLTGGWDSRVVLSYLLPKYTSRFKSYSFGAPTAPDITIPQHIANIEDFDYTPFLLDQHYLDNHFLVDAKNTIMLSNGTRNYKRTHYVHTIRQMGQVSPWLLTGIFGDEVLKVGKPQGGAVISSNAVELIVNNFNAAKTLQLLDSSNTLNLFNDDRVLIKKELEGRINELGLRFGKYKTSGEKYFAFRFAINLRKFFGNEVNSYNDFVWCHSPFIDYDFLKTFARTKYMVSRFDFEEPKLKWQAQSSWLYSELTRRNKPSLTKYQSSRGFSMRDTSTLLGLTKIYLRKFLKYNDGQSIDAFNTKTTNILFSDLIKNSYDSIFNTMNLNKENSIDTSNLQSIVYWYQQISNKSIY